jgi:hypothetical protein
MEETRAHAASRRARLRWKRSQRAGERAGLSADAVRLHRWLGSGKSKNATTPRAHIINAWLIAHVPVRRPPEGAHTAACPFTLIGCAQARWSRFRAKAGPGLRLNEHLSMATARWSSAMPASSFRRQWSRDQSRSRWFSKPHSTNRLSHICGAQSGFPTAMKWEIHAPPLVQKMKGRKRRTELLPQRQSLDAAMNNGFWRAMTDPSNIVRLTPERLQRANRQRALASEYRLEAAVANIPEDVRPAVVQAVTKALKQERPDAFRRLPWPWCERLLEWWDLRIETKRKAQVVVPLPTLR